MIPNVGGGQSGKVQQMRHLHELLHNPLEVDLREPSLEHSSSREEIVARLADLEHRIAMIDALSTVLKEETESLQALLKAFDAADPKPRKGS